MSAAAAAAATTMDVPALQARKEAIVARLKEISVAPFKVQPKKRVATTGSAAAANAAPVVVAPHVVEKTDTHWDYLLKEMQWLAADFSAERKRHAAASKKLAAVVAAYRAGADARDTRARSEAELKRRKLAAKLGRSVVGKTTSFWNKLDRVLTYKQKVSHDAARAAAMNQQLVLLVQQTEKYTESFLGTDDAANAAGAKALTIEEALLAVPTEPRRSKQRVRDYAKLVLLQEENGDATTRRRSGESSLLLYGESTEDSGSDATYSLQNDVSSDDESTLRAAEAEERLERRQRQRRGDDYSRNDNTIDDDDDARSFVADPVELRKLQDEAEMDIDQVLERLREEAGGLEAVHGGADDHDDVRPHNKRRVQFAETGAKDVVSADALELFVPEKSSLPPQQPDAGSDADDDMDASDVEDYDDAGEEEEGAVDKDELDDETTLILLEQEEQLPQELAAAQELVLLQEENEMSVDELRQLYAAQATAAVAPHQAQDEEDNDNDNDDSKPAGKATADASNDALGDTTTTEEEQSRGQSQSEVDELLSTASEDKGDDEDGAFIPGTGDDLDDETTMEAEEKLGRDMSYKEELDLLQNEGEMPIEQLRAMYQGLSHVADEEEEDEAIESEVDDSMNDDDQQPTAAQMFADGTVGRDDGDVEEEEEYEPEDAVDDETTMEAEEKLGRDMSHEEEIAVLQRESEIPVEQLRAIYARMDAEAQNEESGTSGEEAAESETSEPASALPQLLDSVEDQENDEDFQPEEDLKDDETTLEAEERLGREMSAEEEIAMLQKESELPVEELRSLYEKMAEETPRGSEASAAPVPSKRKRTEVESTDDDNKKPRHGAAIDAIDKFEASADLARRTVASRPFLIPACVKLREYQHIGLNWLVSMQSRRLNGILADGKDTSRFIFCALYSRIYLSPHLSPCHIFLLSGVRDGIRQSTYKANI